MHEAELAHIAVMLSFQGNGLLIKILHLRRDILREANRRRADQAFEQIVPHQFR